MSMKVYLPIFGHILVYFFAIYMAISMVYIVENPLWRIIAIIVIIASLWFLIQRETYLPFLGATVFPSSLLGEDRSPKDSNFEAVVPAPEGSRDGMRWIYWAAKPSSQNETPTEAYAHYENAGIATIKNGSALIKLFCPGTYRIPSGRKLKRHIHYRLCCESLGMMSPVRTMWIEC